jgi:hypothetical protein
MKRFSMDWQVWRHGDGPSAYKCAAGAIVRDGESAEALKAAWLKDIIKVFPEHTEFWTHEFIFTATEVDKDTPLGPVPGGPSDPNKKR